MASPQELPPSEHLQSLPPPTEVQTTELLTPEESPSDNGKKPFACNLCDKSYNRKDTLRNHVKYKHTALANPVQCNICQANLANTQSLMVHKWSKHGDGSTPIKCKICGHVSPGAQALSIHINTVHKYPRECEFCGASQLNRKMHRWHVKEVHKMESIQRTGTRYGTMHLGTTVNSEEPPQPELELDLKNRLHKDITARRKSYSSHSSPGMEELHSPQQHEEADMRKSAPSPTSSTIPPPTGDTEEDNTEVNKSELNTANQYLHSSFLPSGVEHSVIQTISDIVFEQNSVGHNWNSENTGDDDDLPMLLGKRGRGEIDNASQDEPQNKQAATEVKHEQSEKKHQDQSQE